ncbi:MAG: hypothetical protein PT939_04970 [Aerococcus suis]|nr:hypothetical protein [Aerococcus suis]
MAKQLDFIDRLADYIDSTGLPFTPVNIGYLGTNESMAIMLLPGGDEAIYLDGVRDKTLNIAIQIKNKVKESTFQANNTLNVLFQLLENLNDLESENGSFDFNTMRLTSAPSKIGEDEHFELWETSFQFDLTLYEK